MQRHPGRPLPRRPPRPPPTARPRSAPRPWPRPRTPGPAGNAQLPRVTIQSRTGARHFPLRPLSHRRFSFHQYTMLRLYGLLEAGVIGQPSARHQAEQKLQRALLGTRAHPLERQLGSRGRGARGARRAGLAVHVPAQVEAGAAHHYRRAAPLLAGAPTFHPLALAPMTHTRTRESLRCSSAPSRCRP